MYELQSQHGMLLTLANSPVTSIYRMEKTKRQGFWEKIAHANITRATAFQDADELFVLTDIEAAQLSNIRMRVFIQAGLVGTLGVLFLYVPFHLFGGSLFPVQDFVVPVLNREISIRPNFLAYSGLLVILEIWYLTYVNIKAVSAISRVCGHPNPADRYYQENLDALIAVGIEKKDKQLDSLGIDPFNNLSKIWLAVFYVLTKMKAALSNVAFTFLVKRLMGRFALRQFVDFAGIPIYAFWNIWAANRVMHETRVRAMAPPLILKCVEALYAEQQDNVEFKAHIYDMLQLISESKRSYHYNHFLLSVVLLNKFDIELQENPDFAPDFMSTIAHLSEQTREGFNKLFVFGIMIDGKISYREKRFLRRLYKLGVIPHPEKKVLEWSHDYFKGKGIDEFLK
ncbi:MAG: hypothetical protein KJN90_02225 [Gammaproteobacteria bacterium]|nr:hypothetical protein [Gammaproteobacteria bacterium]